MTNETLDIFDKKIGSKEKTALQARPVIVLGIKAEVIKGKQGTKNAEKEIGKKLVLICKHPDRAESINISEIKFLKGESVKTSTMWINLDEEGNIQKGSIVAILMEHSKINTLKELEGKTLETALDNNGYLCIKAF